MKKIILFTILISSLALAGCAKKTPMAVSNIDKAGINSIQDKVVDRQTDKQIPQSLSEQAGNNPGEQQKINEVVVTDNWQIYEKPEMNVRLKYHKDWYYDRDEQVEKDLGYNLYIGFAESPKILSQGSPYPIEFLILNKGFEWKYEGYLKEIIEKNDKKYILRTDNKEKYGDILDKMAESFEFIN